MCLLRLSSATESLKFLVPLFDISKHILSPLSNLILRQSDDAADATHTNNVIPKNMANIVCKIFFMAI